VNQAIVLDTNILVSAWLTPNSALSTIVEVAVLRKVPVHVCPAIMAEYQDVLSRSRFERLGPWEPWLDRLLQVAFRNPDPAPWPHLGPDPDDLVFLALAKTTGSMLVTGNLADFPKAIREGVPVLTPAEYLQRQ